MALSTIARVTFNTMEQEAQVTPTICVEKSFQPGHEKLEREGYRVHALAKVTGIQDGKLLVED